MGRRKVSISLMKGLYINHVATSVGKNLNTGVYLKRNILLHYMNQEKEIIVCEFVAAKLLG